MVRTRTEAGKSINVRGLQREAGQSGYEFAYEAEGFGANPAGQTKPPTGSRNKAGRPTPTRAAYGSLTGLQAPGAASDRTPGFLSRPAAG